MITSWQSFSLGNFPQFATTHFPFLRFIDLKSIALAPFRREHVLRFPGRALESARLLLGSLEGAMLVARSYGDAGRFTSAAQRLLSELSGSRKKTMGRTDRKIARLAR